MKPPIAKAARTCVTLCALLLVGVGDSAGDAYPTPATSGRTAPDSGIYGQMVSAWGNPPAHPPTYPCVRVLDASGTNLVVSASCSGTWGSFRVPLRPGKYTVEIGGEWMSEGGAVHFKPRRQGIEIKPGQWVRLGAAPMRAPPP